MCGGGVKCMLTLQSLHQCTLSRPPGLEDQPGFVVRLNWTLKYRKPANILNCDFPTPVSCDDG